MCKLCIDRMRAYMYVDVYLCMCICITSVCVHEMYIYIYIDMCGRLSKKDGTYRIRCHVSCPLT